MYFVFKPIWKVIYEEINVLCNLKCISNPVELYAFIIYSYSVEL